MSETAKTPGKERRLPATLLAAVGFLLSAVLEVLHVRAYEDPAYTSFCTIGTKLDCTTVALSEASVILGLPLPIWGMAGFLALGNAAWTRSRLLLPLSAIAALVSLGLLVVELTMVGSVCLLCEGVHLVSLALFAVAVRQRGTLKPEIDRKALLRLFGAPVLLVAVGYLFVPPYYKLFSWRAGVSLPHGVTTEGQPWIGAEDPEIVLHEFTDYGCPHCALAASRSRELLAKHPDRVRVVRHQQPRMRCDIGGKYACQYARAAVCAGEQGKFWEMDTWLFKHAPGKGTVDYEQAAKDVGLSHPELRACMDAPETIERVTNEAKEARKKKIKSTPAYTVDGERMYPKQLAGYLRGVL